jgi:transcriptional regulator with XRE-family HTH domain
MYNICRGCDEMNQDIIVRNLILLRKTNNLTQKELSLKLNYSDKVISKWERGESLPDILALNEIAKYYNVKIDELINKEYNQDIIVKTDTNIEVKKVKEPSKIFVWSLFLAIISLFLAIIIVIVYA